MAKELAKKGHNPNTGRDKGMKRGNVGSDRFANSRLKPPGYNSKPPRNGSNDGNKDKFQNTGF